MNENKEQNKREDFNNNYKRILSHQLKSPIDSILSMLKTVYQGFTGELNPKTRFFIEKSINRINETKSLISDLIDYEFYSKKNIDNKYELDIIYLLNTLINKYISISSEKNISINCDLPLNTKLIILGNTKALDLAIRNLIENAIKYTPVHGYISITLKYSNKKKCYIDFIDTGYGIPEEDLDNIFVPFYRSFKHKSNTPGTGLGLTIAKRIITTYGGSISVSSKENKGTTFTITLPYKRVEKSDVKEKVKKRVIIIGGVTAGPKAGARLRRLDEDIDITIIEKGEYLSYSGCGIPSYISDKVHSPRALMSTSDNTIRDIEFFKIIKKIRVLNKTEAISIDRENKTVKIKDLITNEISNLPYDYLIIGTGSIPYIPKIPGIKNKGIYSLYNVEDAESIKRMLSSKKARDVFIIGCGLVGIETAESLIESGARVTIMEKLPDILLNHLDKDFSRKIQNVLSRKGIKIITDIRIEKIVNDNNQIILITDRGEYYADLLIISAGVKPNSNLAKKAGIKTGNFGGIIVNKYLQTSDKYIYGIGDCTENTNLITKKYEYWPLGSIATKTGRICADNISGLETEINGFLCTVMFKVFDINIGRTGLTSENAKKNGFNIESIVISGLDRSHYSKEAHNIFLKIISNKETGVILGAQGFGIGDVISRIEILASTITNSMKLYDIFKMDLGYYPSYNNPIDILQTACLVLKNKISGLVKTKTIKEFNNEKDKFNIIDVSPLSDHAFHSIPNSINIPLENIRSGEIPFDKKSKIILYSKTSSGAYEAYRILLYNGYNNSYVLEGGLKFWET